MYFTAGFLSLRGCFSCIPGFGPRLPLKKTMNALNYCTINSLIVSQLSADVSIEWAGLFLQDLSVDISRPCHEGALVNNLARTDLFGFLAVCFPPDNDPELVGTFPRIRRLEAAFRQLIICFFLGWVKILSRRVVF